MPLPVIANTFLVSVHVNSSHELHTMANVFCVQTDGTGTEAQVLEEAVAAYAAHISPIMRSDCVIQDGSIIALDGVSPVFTEATPSAGTAGGHSTGNALPNELARVMTFRSATRGRKARGRLYVIGSSDDELVNVEVRGLTTTAITDLSTAASGFHTALNGTGAHSMLLMVLSRRHATAYPVVTTSANPNMCNQRRRFEKVAHR